MKYLLCTILAIASFSLNAATITWVGGFGNQWNTANNWDLGTIPNAGDDVVIGDPSLPFVSVAIVNSNAAAKSLTVKNAQFSINLSRALIVSGTNVAYPTSIYFENAVFSNNGVLEYTGGMKCVQTTISNGNFISSNGNLANTPISLELDNSSLNNFNILSVVQFKNNVEAGTNNNKDILLLLNNSSQVINNGFIVNVFDPVQNDWSNKGIEINNGSSLTNLASSLISLTSMRENGIHIKNDLSIVPNSKMENRGTLSISKCTTCNFGEFTCGIKIDENAQYDNFPTSSTVTITDYTEINDKDICVFGTIGSFGSISGTAVDMGNYSFDPHAVLQGTGVVVIDNGLNDGFTATVFPGGPMIGQLRIQGPFTSTSDTKFLMKIEGNGEPGMMMGYDQIDWGTDETLLSMSSIKVVLEDGFVPNVGDQFQIFTGTALIGTFENLDLPGSNDSWQIDYDFNGDGSNDGVMLTVIAPITNVNNAGIGTATPRTKLEVNGGDILLSSIGTGVVLTSPGGLYYKITVDDNGVLQTELIPCPEVWECP